MTVFILSVVIVVVVSAACSLTEAALYSVRLPYIRRLADSGSTSGAVLQILLAFSVLFTLSVLLFSEIIPKLVGVLYNRPVARRAAVPLNALVTLLHPIISLVERVSKRFKPKGLVIAAPEDEVRQFAMLSAEEGSIMQSEAELVKNALALDKVTAREIMTPRTVVEKLSDATSVREAARAVEKTVYSRIPVFDDEDPETWVGVVLTRDVLAAYARNELDITLGSLARPIDFIPEQTPGHILLRKFIKTRRHLFAVADEYGGVVGVVTLEDILESVIGQEIMDEVDVTEDLQELAKQQRKRQIREADAGQEAAPASEPSSTPKDRP